MLQRLAGNRAAQRLVNTSGGEACCAGCAHGATCEESSAQRETHALAAPAASGTVVATEGQDIAIPAEAEIDTSELDAMPEPQSSPVAGQDVQTIQRQGGGGAGGPQGAGAACNVFADLTTFPRLNRGRRAFAAQTAFSMRHDRNGFSAVFNRADSWVNTFQVPITGVRTVRVRNIVQQCRRAFTRPTNASFFNFTPDATCPAVAASPHTATNARECETVIGAGLDAENRADIIRLTRHEQYHLKLACALADAANTAVAAGTQVRLANRQLATASRRETRAYDDETNHGCDAAEQARWESDIDAGKVTFP